MKRFTAKNMLLEGLEDNYLSHSFDFPTKKLLPQISSAPSSARGRTQDNRENSTRLPKIEGHLKELLKITTESDIQGLTKYHETEFFNSILAITDNIFSLYNIKINVISVEEYDSALCITPATNLKVLVRCLYCIAELVTKLPFTFITALDLNKFTICGKICLLKDNYKLVYENRVISNAMFGIYDLKTYDQIERHFYKIILGKMQKKDASQGYEWPIDIQATRLPPLSSGKAPRTSRTILLPKLSGFKLQERKHTFSFSERDNTPKSAEREIEKAAKVVKDRQKEQIEAMRQIINVIEASSITKISRVNQESRFIKERLEAIDPVGYGWWEEIGKLVASNAANMFTSGCLFD